MEFGDMYPGNFDHGVLWWAAFQTFMVLMTGALMVLFVVMAVRSYDTVPPREASQDDADADAASAPQPEPARVDTAA